MSIGHGVSFPYTEHISNETKQCAVHPELHENNLWSNAFSGVSNAFTIQVQAASRTYLAKRNFCAPSIRLSYASSAPSLACLTRDLRYARAEAALRVALSRCETEPSPLELQVRVMEKGLQAWNVRVGRGYERVRKAEEALAGARQEGDLARLESRGSMSQLHREKWMGIKERDEALEMVDKIKDLIAELNGDIKEGLKTPIHHKASQRSYARASDNSSEASTLDDTSSTKAPILFTGRLPPPYLENLPRYRRSVEPLLLSPGQTKLNSILSSEPAATMLSASSTTWPSTPPSTTTVDPLDYFGAALIHTPIPHKSTAQYLAEMAACSKDDKRARGHTRLPSYASNLLDEFSQDRIGNDRLSLNASLGASSSMKHSSIPESRERMARPLAPTSPMSTPSKRRPMAFLGRPFSSSSSTSSLSPSPVQTPRSDDRPDFFTAPHDFDDRTDFDKLLQSYSHALCTPSSLNSAPGSPLRNSTLLAPVQIPQLRKRPSKLGYMVDNMRKGMRKVVRIGD